ncbi:unnamed protein product [Protopolystoma xenopodis]|uniref:VWFD domain-containing protein n=1 Tax=Protopolystoma xenopodis TaxID=117903 RepID=A0A448WGB4_9PLAT|nr:unnamed protein product [Protopolystoma xenopodis]
MTLQPTFCHYALGHHVTTFDGAKLDFLAGSCEYLLIEPAPSHETRYNSSLHGLSIRVRASELAMSGRNQMEGRPRVLIIVAEGSKVTLTGSGILGQAKILIDDLIPITR